MATHTSHTLANGHTLTVVSDPSGTFRVQERNELGTFIRHAYAARDRADALRWVASVQARAGGVALAGTSALVDIAEGWRRDDESAELVLAAEAELERRRAAGGSHA